MADVRDYFANVFVNLDTWAAIFNVGGFVLDFIPAAGVAGDAAKALPKLGRFVAKYADDAPKVVEAIIRSSKLFPNADEVLPGLVKILPAGALDDIAGSIKNGDKITKADYTELQKVFETAGKNLDETVEGMFKPIREQMLESPSAKLWGILEDGTNQGVKHFADYWKNYPEHIPSLAERLGVDVAKFENTVDGFNNFTNQALKVKNNSILREVNGKQIYYLDGATNIKKGIVLIFKDGKIQSMMPSDIKSFNKLQ